MNISLKKLIKYEFNRRSLTEQDFYHICEQEGITIIERYQSNCFYFTVEGVPFITIGTRKRGLKRLFAMFHELSHYFLHSGKDPQEVFFFGLTETKQEMEADVFATIALIPFNKIDDYDFLDEHPNKFARRVFNDRKKIEFLYKV
ncbi:MAG TPA: ImmA/IrrE family metallo-endopeptidase [Pyrinomonadaceae bacterium]|nr:ImmA/IrrE family metallo-endopeptidase [Pyrinomonadaceae bacterium]